MRIGTAIEPGAPRRAFVHGRLSAKLAWLALLIALGACSSLRPKAPPAKRTPPAHASVPAGPRVTDPGNYEKEKSRIKATLAGNERDSLAPSEVGYYMDVLQGRLKQSAVTGMTIARQRDSIAVSAVVRDGFDPAGTQLTPGLRDILAPLAKTLLEYRKTVASLRVAPAGVNDQRASAVARYLISNGIAGKRIVIAGAGRTPTAAGAAEGIVRVEVRIEPVVRAPAGHR